jgi:hypothetical protein
MGVGCGIALTQTQWDVPPSSVLRELLDYRCRCCRVCAVVAEQDHQLRGVKVSEWKCCLLLVTSEMPIHAQKNRARRVLVAFKRANISCFGLYDRAPGGHKPIPQVHLRRAAHHSCWALDSKSAVSVKARDWDCLSCWHCRCPVDTHCCGIRRDRAAIQEGGGLYCKREGERRGGGGGGWGGRKTGEQAE